jgi:hypothetical protein
MSELDTVISKIAKKYPDKKYEKKGSAIYYAYRDGVMSGNFPIYSFTSEGMPQSTPKQIALITGYTAPEVLIFMAELHDLTKKGVISSKLLNPKLDVEQAVSKKEFEKMKPGLIDVPDFSKNMKKITYPIVIPAVIIIGLIVPNNVVKLKKHL